MKSAQREYLLCDQRDRRARGRRVGKTRLGENVERVAGRERARARARRVKQT